MPTAKTKADKQLEMLSGAQAVYLLLIFGDELFKIFSIYKYYYLAILNNKQVIAILNNKQVIAIYNNKLLIAIYNNKLLMK